ncbi:hypothetical protein [uncultured Dokdonia sp.]|uniref:hypothetical protein n=1 Tax=uncultured Dokdonia sp. TaxID=575653 RepID=UPI002634C9EF|nr:hypothetical protein [uncultured Dokdonia sp.]
MKFFILIILLVSLNVFSQKKEISDLEKIKQVLVTEINILNDSVKKIDIQIAVLKSKEIKKMVSDSTLVSTARKGAYILNSSNVLGEVITMLTEKKQVLLLDYFDGYFGICTDSICGYMSELWIEKNEKIYEFIKVKKQEQKELKRLENENKLKLKKAEFVKLEKDYIKKYGQKTYEKLKEGYYWTGMSREMATISLGSPNDINRTVGSWGVHEQWVYDDIYLYFENGKLTSYQN